MYRAGAGKFRRLGERQSYLLIEVLILTKPTIMNFLDIVHAEEGRFSLVYTSTGDSIISLTCIEQEINTELEKPFFHHLVDENECINLPYYCSEEECILYRQYFYKLVRMSHNSAMAVFNTFFDLFKNTPGYIGEPVKNHKGDLVLEVELTLIEDVNKVKEYLNKNSIEYFTGRINPRKILVQL